mgnify:FL=1
MPGKDYYQGRAEQKHLDRLERRKERKRMKEIQKQQAIVTENPQTITVDNSENIHK